MDPTMNNTPMYVTFASQANLLVGWRQNGNFLIPICHKSFKVMSVTPTVDGRTACPILTQMLTNGRYPDSQISVTVGPSHSTRLLVAWKYEAWLQQLPAHELYFAKPANSDSRFSIPNPHLSNNSGWLHEHEITAVLTFVPLNLIITGDCSGCIKVWDDIFRQLAVLNNHFCEITHLVVSPLSQSVADTQSNNMAGFASVDQTGVMKLWQFNKWCHLYCPTEEPLRTKTEDHKPGQNQSISVNEIDTVHVFETCGTQRSEVRSVNCLSVDILKLFMSQDGKCLTILGSRPTKSTIDGNITLERWKAIEVSFKMCVSMRNS
ncbi:hypothetical protein PHET_09871 [Paragonimus heterotremus]|uniref:Uncharacterized protein n=1 Tax=Paragonimus heterotremus TaxID=100268 RepID=A0A8J4WEI1_9TREM|nr:hypothetical protein PHET_09871 [Paragonimus heterotremus]